MRVRHMAVLKILKIHAKLRAMSKNFSVKNVSTNQKIFKKNFDKSKNIPNLLW